MKTLAVDILLAGRGSQRQGKRYSPITTRKFGRAPHAIPGLRQVAQAEKYCENNILINFECERHSGH